MKNTSRFLFSTLAGTVHVAGALAVPPANTHQSTPPAQQTTPQTQSVSGKIASVDQNSFTLTVGSGSTVSTDQSSAASSMSFTIDKNTTVDGKLKVGSAADVTYRTDNGSNVAISVHVTP